MSPRTVTLPPTEPAMWRKLLAKVHPDASGDHDLFIWTRSLQEHVAGGQVKEKSSRTPPRQPSREEADCVPFDPLEHSDFRTLTRRALDLADGLAEPFASTLRLLEDCEPSYIGKLYQQQDQGASYKQLAAIGHKVGMDKSQRVFWYRVAERIPLTRRHAGHMLGRLS